MPSKIHKKTVYVVKKNGKMHTCKKKSTAKRIAGVRHRRNHK